MSMLNIIKKAGVGAVGATNPVAIMFGTVTKANPLEVNVDQRFTLTEDFLIIPESLMEYKVELEGELTLYQPPTPPNTTSRVLAIGESVTLRRGLNAGDKLILFRVQGGHKYLILDRVWQG